MAYLIYAFDFEGVGEKREIIREAHRAHLRSMGKKLLGSGALLAEDGETIIGGMTLIDTESYAEAEKFLLDDPYHKAGIRKEFNIIKWRRRWWNGEFLGL